MEFTGERYIPDSGLDLEIEIEHLQRYLSVRGLVRDKVVVDAASGSGYGTAILSETASLVLGLEISHEAVDYAAKQYSTENLFFQQGSVENLPFLDGSVDVLISFETIEHVPEEVQQKFLLEIKRVLKKDGILVISSPDKKIYSDQTGYQNDYHIKEFYRDEFHSFLSERFKKVEFYDQFAELSYLLIGNNCQKLELLRAEETHPVGKYIIALCSDAPLPIENFTPTIAIDNESSYQKKSDRVLELQDEIVEKNKVITHLEGVVNHLERSEQNLRDKISTLDTVIVNKENVLAEKKSTVQNLIERKEVLEQTTKNLQKELTSERRKAEEYDQKLQNIHSSKAWKIIKKIYWLKSKILPF